ncbi:MAG: bifunctional 3,4-dihydroxy-2-butanone-4-phosphate synthase/GTP cyclohydrolase II [Clostridium sp.]|nr:bifunctional 3,4-dihydroxy-2-butanone-4-phosphate synthase/GTP cyclohydrolase II [Clostridium sp.]
MFKFNTIEEAIEDIKNGKMIIVIDDPNRENEGDLLMAAEHVTGEAINFMTKFGRGLVCMPMEEERIRQLKIPQMVENNTDNHETAFTASIDYVETTTGISAFDRALTIEKAITSYNELDFRKPGHVFPLVAKSGGVLERTGHTEAAVDLAKLAGLRPAGVICEIMNDDGTMARTSELIEFSNRHQLLIITIEDLVKYRIQKEKPVTLVERVVETNMPTKYGDFKMYGFIDKNTGEEHVALVKGKVEETEIVLTRVHSECLTGDALGSKRCDCGEQYDAAMRKIAKEGQGVLLYMRQEGRGIGLINKLKAYEIQDKGYDTVEANVMLGFLPDMRKYDVAAAILKDLGVTKVKLMTNNPEKIEALSHYEIEIVDRVPIQIKENEKNRFYLRTKQIKMNHLVNY